jgi:hypothetical protein
MIGNSPFGEMEKSTLTVQRIMEIASAASTQDVIDCTTAHTMTVYDLERKLEREKKIEKLTIDDPYEASMIEVLDSIINNGKRDRDDLSLALTMLEKGRDTFSRYDEYMYKIGLIIK